MQGFGFISSISGAILSLFERISNKVTAITGSSTDIQYPSAKLLYDKLQTKQDNQNSGTLNTVLHGNASGPLSFTPVTEDDLSLSNNTTNNATPAKHGLLPILSNIPSQFLNGQGNFATPAGVPNSYLEQSFNTQTSVTVTHNFGAHPVVQIIDNTGAVIVPLSIVNNTLNDFTVTFTNPTTGNIIASVGSPQPQQLIVVNGNYIVLITDRIVKVTAQAVTITLPTAVGNSGREFIINNASTGNITVNTTASQLINDQLNQLIPSKSSMTVYSDGTGYNII
jgi:hypothetical protein